MTQSFNSPHRTSGIIQAADMVFINDVFEMSEGFVLRFSNQTFSDFFLSDINVDIDDPKYFADGSSKAKRLRYFLKTVDKSTAIKTLKALWEVREAGRKSGVPYKTENAEGRFLALIDKLEGNHNTDSIGRPPSPATNRPAILKLKNEMGTIWHLPPQTRGYAFEKFLKELFDLHDLAAREPFRLIGEQIDGSFQFNNETYLLEAKWIHSLIGVAELHTFHGKIEQKAAWTRGLFVSFSGFTDVGLTAFGRGKRLICMDGKDLFDMLDREIPLKKVLEGKLRKAAESGAPFVAVRELFPD